MDDDFSFQQVCHVNPSEGQHMQRICPLWGFEPIIGDIFTNCALWAHQVPD